MESGTWTNLPDGTNLDSFPKISISELGTLLRCTKKHDYAYRQGLSKADPPSFLGKGRYLHALMERWLDTYQDPPPPALEVIGQVTSDLGATADLPPDSDKDQLDQQFANFVETVDMDGVHITAVEQEFWVDIGLVGVGGVPVLLHGVFDAILENEQGHWLVEHKTAGRAWSQNQFAWDLQSRLYGAALRALGYHSVVGTLWNFFYPKRWDQITTYTDLDEEQAFTALAQNAIRLRDSEIIVHQPHWGCNDCWFKDLCHAELIGTEDGYIRATQYVADPDKVARFTEGE